MLFIRAVTPIFSKSICNAKSELKKHKPCSVDIDT